MENHDVLYFTMASLFPTHKGEVEGELTMGNGNVYISKSI